MITFTVTLYGPSEHTERNTAQALWDALERGHANTYRERPEVAMLIGQAVYAAVMDEPPMSGRDKQKVA
jgi:hypothetical protein